METEIGERMLKHFTYNHLPAHLQETSKVFCDQAQWVVANLAKTPERTVVLRKLLEAKDAAVRCKV